MDVSVKQAYDRLITVCDSLEDLKHHIWTKEIRRNIAEDIYGFIRLISKKKADDRYNAFDAECQSNLYPEVYIITDGMNIENIESGSPSDLFYVLNGISGKIKDSVKIRPDEIYVAFFAELGKYYLISKTDKSDIEKAKYLEYIEELRFCIGSTKKSGGTVQTAEKQKSIKEERKTEKEKKGSEDNLDEKTEESLEELMEQLNGLTGLEGVKGEVNSLINILKIKKIRESRGMETANISKHLVFLGNPGTGKTTVARLLSKIYKKMGILEKGQLVEVDRAGLVAGYVGQTALKTKEKIDEAMGGILFVDEAYTLVKGGNDFGQEAIDTILKAMEDNRDNFVEVVAGYPEPMEVFLDSNPGLKSRFNKKILFEDYSEEEMYQIFEAFCKPYGMQMNGEAKEQLKKYLSWLVNHKTENFANAREMRNLFEASLSNQANRLAVCTELTNEELNEIRMEDFPDYVKKA